MGSGDVDHVDVLISSERFGGRVGAVDSELGRERPGPRDIARGDGVDALTGVCLDGPRKEAGDRSGADDAPPEARDRGRVDEPRRGQ